MSEIIAVLIIVAAVVAIPPIFFCGNSAILGYKECLRGWCILLAIIIGIAAAVLGIYWAFGVLFTTN